MPRLPGICQECGAVYPSPLRADGPGDAPAFDVPAPCPVCGGSGRVPPDVLDRLAAAIEGAGSVGGDPGRLQRIAARIREAALGLDEELAPEEERVRRARLRTDLESHHGSGGALVEGLPGFRHGEVEAFLRLVRIAVELEPADPSARVRDDAGVDRLLEVAFERYGPAEPEEGSETGPVERARRRLGAAGRNDPCPCGSGEKYKDCHWVADLRETR